MDEEKPTLEEVIKKVLQKDDRARTDTNWFVFQVLRTLEIRVFLDYRDLKKMPSIESILKTRRTVLHKKNLFHEEYSEEGVTYEKPQ